MGQVNQQTYDQSEAIKQGFEIKYGNGGVWPKGKIYYSLDNMIKKSPTLYKKVMLALNEWNKKNSPHCVFIQKKTQDCIRIKRDDDSLPHSKVGYYQEGSYMSLPKQFPSGQKLEIVSILHEMMHCAGFLHENSRKDRNKHIKLENEDDIKIEGVEIGNYDYQSIMQLCELHNMKYKNEEMKDKYQLMKKLQTFSAGDLSQIKQIYGKKGQHHGEWHPGLLEGQQSCKPLYGGTNCGFQAKEIGHWTCCMNVIKKSECLTSHSGFWHSECVDKRCSSGKCVCNNCGGGCTYKGSKAHWSCCENEYIESKCTLQEDYQLDDIKIQQLLEKNEDELLKNKENVKDLKELNDVQMQIGKIECNLQVQKKD